MIAMIMHQRYESVNVVLPIRWIKQAWVQVSTTTINNYCFEHCGAMPTESEELTDPFVDLDTQESDVANLNELLTPLNSGITAAEYLDQEDDLCTCFTFDETEKSDWREGLRAEVVAYSSPPKKAALEKENNSDSSDEVECTKINR